MKYKIGIFGSDVENLDHLLPKLQELSDALSQQNIILVTGARPGVPYRVALNAFKKNKTEIWGFSPTKDLKSHLASVPQLDNTIYKKLFYIPKDYEFIDDFKIAGKYRNVTSTANCDGGIIIAGRWGSMNEFTNLFDMGKVIGVLTGTGGIADELESLSKKITKDRGAKVLFNSDPKKLVEDIIGELDKRKLNL